MEKIKAEELMEKLGAEALSDDELENVVGGVQWSCFGQCVIDGGGEDIPELEELVTAINQMDSVAVAIHAVKDLSSGMPLLVDCWNAC